MTFECFGSSEPMDIEKILKITDKIVRK